MEKSIRILSELKTLGVRLAIDDFGTGYSSLSYLRQFPVDTLKLDRSFVREITVPEDGAIARGIIAMAHSLNLRVLAEGVETLGQLEFLKEHACDRLQGYLFSRPLPALAFEKFVAHKGTETAGGVEAWRKPGRGWKTMNAERRMQNDECRKRPDGGLRAFCILRSAFVVFSPRDPPKLLIPESLAPSGWFEVLFYPDSGRGGQRHEPRRLDPAPNRRPAAIRCGARRARSARGGHQ